MTSIVYHHCVLLLLYTLVIRPIDTNVYNKSPQPTLTPLPPTPQLTCEPQTYNLQCYLRVLMFWFVLYRCCICCGFVVWGHLRVK